MSKKNFLIVVGGSTASGKTEMAIHLARHYGTVILSADSRQFYREMNIGTAKPTAAERATVPHYFIDSLSIEDTYSAGAFERDALALLQKLFQTHRIVVLVGGSGLFIKALCEGLDVFPPVPAAIKQALEDRYQREGIAFLQAELKRVDPEYAQKVDLNNPHRLLRALAIYRASGRPFSSFRRRHAPPREFRPVYLQMHLPRPELYRRINQRVDDMLKAGLEEEARRLYPFRNRPALDTVGYREFFEYFDGQHSLEETVRLIKRNTRRYAKRQLTWMRRDGYWKHLHPQDWSGVIAFLELALCNGKTLHQTQAGTALPDLSFLHAPPRSGWQQLEWSEHERAGQGIYFNTGAKTHWIVLPTKGEHPKHKWLFHEALYRSRRPRLAIIPAPIELFAKENGFKAVSANELPPQLKAWFKQFRETFSLVLLGQEPPPAD